MNKCVCKTGMFLIAATNQCDECKDECLTCLNKDTCIKCKG